VGLEASRWAAEDGANTNKSEESGPTAAAEGEDLGSSIEGTVGDPLFTRGIHPGCPFPVFDVILMRWT
jgi:hypothetical protein